MLIYRILSAIAAAALGAAVTLALPGFSPQVEARVEAGISNPVVKTDSLVDRPLGPDCSSQEWPYYRPECLRDQRQASGAARVVRIVSTDRLPK